MERTVDMKRALLISNILLFTLFIASGRADINVVGPLADDRTVLPGNKYDGIILLRNTSDAPQKVKLEQTEYNFKSDGSNSYGIPGSNKRSNAKWIKIPVKDLIIPPRSDISFNFSVNVPPDNKLKGTYWSVLMLIPEIEIPKMPATGESMGVVTLFQYGYQITSTISDTGSVSLKFTGREVASSEGRMKLKVAIANDGERLIIPKVWAELFDDSGKNIGKFEAPKQRIYPGCSISSLIDIENVPGGHYKALVIADTGIADPFGAQYDLTVKK